MAEEQKRSRGRPTVATEYFGNAAQAFGMIMSAGKKVTKRSIADYVYCDAALRIIKEAASEIPFVEEIFSVDREKEQYCRSILSQLGRMSIQDSYTDVDVIAIARIAAEARHDKCTVKQIEKYIRRGRMTGEW